MTWEVKYFPAMKLYDAYRWTTESDCHIALHENPPAFSRLNVRAIHIMGRNPDTLREYGQGNGCSTRILSVMGSHGRKKWRGIVIYHYDDYRKNLHKIYSELSNE